MPIVLLDDDDPLGLPPDKAADLLVAAGVVTIRGIARGLRDQGFRRRNSLLEAEARRALERRHLARDSWHKALPPAIVAAGFQVARALRLIDRQVSVLAEHREQLETGGDGAWWRAIFASLDAFEAARDALEPPDATL